MEEIDEIWDFIRQVENDANDILIGVEMLSDKIHEIDVDDEEEFEISDKEVEEMLNKCGDISERIPLLEDSVEELKEGIGKLKKLRIILALEEKKEEED